MRRAPSLLIAALLLSFFLALAASTAPGVPERAPQSARRRDRSRRQPSARAWLTNARMEALTAAAARAAKFLLPNQKARLRDIAAGVAKDMRDSVVKARLTAIADTLKPR